MRKRILTLVDSNLSRKSESRSRVADARRQLDFSVLVAVAKVLHDWDPSASILELGRRLNGLSGPDSDAA